MTRILASLLLCFAFCGCVNRQQAADSIAGIRAAQALIDAGHPESARSVLDAAIHYELASIGIALSDLPAPTYSPKEIAEDQRPYLGSVPPEPQPSPWGAGMVGGITTAALGLLWFVGRVAPGFPALGPMVGKVADVGWAALSTRNQRQADAVASTVTNAARDALPVLKLVAMNHAAMPPELRESVTPERLAALATMATLLSSRGENKAAAHV
jgi:hypothetical protein